MDRTVYWTRFTYQEWRFYLAATVDGLCFVGTPSEDLNDLKKWAKKRLPGHELKEDPSKLRPYGKEITDYLDGHRQKFTVPIRLQGTPFQLAVWQALMTIPFGEVTSYSSIAKIIDNPKAVRAVGAAVGANPLLLVVPCHRVLGKDGTLTGFRGGLDMKRQLLKLEQTIR